MLLRRLRTFGMVSAVLLASCAGNESTSTVVERFGTPIVLTQLQNDPLLGIVNLGERRIALVGSRTIAGGVVTGTVLRSYGVGPSRDGSRSETTVALDANSRPTRAVSADGTWIDFSYDVPGKAMATIYGIGGKESESVSYDTSTSGGRLSVVQDAPGTVKVTCGNTAIDMPLTLSFKPRNQISGPTVVYPVGLTATSTGSYRTDLPGVNDNRIDPTTPEARRTQLVAMLDQFESRLSDDSGLRAESVPIILSGITNGGLRGVAERILGDVLMVLHAKPILAGSAAASSLTLKNEPGTAIYRALPLSGSMKTEESDANYNNGDLATSFDFSPEECRGLPFVDSWEGSFTIDGVTINCNLAIAADKSAVLTWSGDGTVQGTLSDSGRLTAVGTETIGVESRKWRVEADLSVNNATLTGTGRFIRTDGAESPHAESAFNLTRVFSTSKGSQGVR